MNVVQLLTICLAVLLFSSLSAGLDHYGFLGSNPCNPTCCNVAGDSNDDSSVNVGDGVHLIGYVFKGGPAPYCPPEGDANADGNINVGDAVLIINYVFKGGVAPTCGPA